MTNIKRKNKNKYWLENDSVFELHYNNGKLHIVILKFMRDVHDSKKYIYVSDFLKVEYDEIIAESVDDAMEQFEYMVMDHIEDEISYYEGMLEKFQEESYG